MEEKKVIIESLEMHNFKCFYGEHLIELRSNLDSDQPIILIGGDNGRGKTSIQEAIYYSLYEDDDLPGIQTRPNYLKAVSERLNRKALDENINDYLIALEISMKGDGPDKSYRIERKWEVDVQNRKALHPILKIYEDNKELEHLKDNPNAYQDFLRSIIPPRISRFFLFDGERIQEFADDELHERNFIQSIEDILHINVYKTLKEDLKDYVLKEFESELKKGKLQDDYHDLIKSKEDLSSNLSEKKRKIEFNRQELDSLKIQELNMSGELKRLNISDGTRRTDLLLEEERLQKESDDVSNQISNLFEKQIILLSGNLIDKLKDELENEIKFSNIPEYQSNIIQRLSLLKERLFQLDPKLIQYKLTDEQYKYYVNSFEIISREVFELKSDINLTIHDIGMDLKRTLIDEIKLVKETRIKIKDLINNKERILNDIREINKKIKAACDDPRIQDLSIAKDKINQDIGALKSENINLEGEIQRIEADIANREKQISDRVKKRQVINQTERALELSYNIINTLDDFIKRLAPKKLSILSKYMEEMYFKLKKPEYPISKIEIKPENWEVMLFDQTNRPLEKRQFSAGMKEMYALSLLWALSKASGKQLPIVIDTPVGRLDTTNRRSLFEKYLPYAGHQVIVLSTDTEIDREWAKKLEKYVSKQYRLDYDSNTNSIKIVPGYFF